MLRVNFLSISKNRFLLTIASICAIAGCADNQEDPVAGADDKDLYRDSTTGKTDDGFDFCQAFNWYGDGECDSFCAKRDSDCATDAREPELHDVKDVFASKISMLNAVKQFEVNSQSIIEAKFETNGAGDLALSLYPLANVATVDAERVTFSEVAGNPTTTPFATSSEQFTDFEHITRSTRDLTLVQLSNLSLRDAVSRGAVLGNVYWTIPTMQNGRAGYGVYGVDGDGDSNYAFIDGAGSRKRQITDQGVAARTPTDGRGVELGADLAIVRTSKITMLQAIDAAQSHGQKIIEAKFELDHINQLSLSLYPVRDISLDAERSELGELAGNPTATAWNPVFSKFDVPDNAHLIVASRDLTLVQAAGMSLRSAVVKVNARFPGGYVYWAIPTRQGTRAGYGICVLDRNNNSHYLFVS
jgi:hypothetical protein